MLLLNFLNINFSYITKLIFLYDLIFDVDIEYILFLVSTVTIKGSSLFMPGIAKIGAESNFFFNVSKASFASSVHTNSPVCFLVKSFILLYNLRKKLCVSDNNNNNSFWPISHSLV